MKNRTKTISLLMALCMMLTLLPAVAFAAETPVSSVIIGGVTLDSSNPYYKNGGAYGTEDDYNAKFDSTTGTLTLKNIKCNTWSEEAVPLEVTGTGTTLTIKLEGNNILEVGPGKSAISASGKTIVIQGSGSLTAYSSNSGNGITGNVTVSGGSLTAYSSLGGYGITGKVTVSSGSLTAYSSLGGNGITGNVTVSGGSLTAYCGTSGNGIFGNAEVFGGSLTAYSEGFGIGISGTLEISGGMAEVSGNGGSIGGITNIDYSSAFNPQIRSGDRKSWAKVNTAFTNGGTINDKYVYIGPAIYLVSFNANVDDPYEIEGRMEPQYINKGEGKALTPNAFTRDGYTFNGWNTDRNGNGTAYAGESTIQPTEDITLYAQWTQNNTGTGGGGGNTGGGTGTGGTTSGGNTGTSSGGYSGPSIWYIGGNTFGTSTSQVPTSVEIDNLPVSFTMNGSNIVVGCVAPDADRIRVTWGSVSNSIGFTPDAAASCAQVFVPKTGSVSVMAFALMAVIAAAGAMGKK